MTARLVTTVFAIACSIGAFGSSALMAQESAAPRFLLQWGKEGSADGEFEFPIGIAIHEQVVLITDHYNNRIQKFDLEGKFLATFDVLPNPGGMAVDRTGRIYISHFPATRAIDPKYPDRISVYNIEGTFVREWGQTGKGDGEFDYPGGIAIGPDDRIYIADQTNRRMQVFDSDGKFLAKFGEYGVQPGQFGGNSNPKARNGGPNFVAFDKQGQLFTTEASMGRVQKLSRDGQPILSWGNLKDEVGGFGGAFSGFKDKPTSMQGPIGIAVDNDGHIWVSSINGRIQQFDASGKLLNGIQGHQGSEPSQFLAPHGLVLDHQRNLFVVDSFNHRIQKFATAR